MVSGTFWDFNQYYDPSTQNVVIMQIGWNGTLGTGPLIATEDGSFELIQTFTGPDGNTRKEKHSYSKPNADTEITTAYNLDADNTWVTGRTYKWRRQSVK
jgi:hypothetical protein